MSISSDKKMSDISVTLMHTAVDSRSSDLISACEALNENKNSVEFTY